jgi:hypothetical protein
MANVYAVKSGSWSDTTVWNTGALPTSADDVYCNGFVVTIDISPTVLSFRNSSATGISAGGGLAAVNGQTLTLTGTGLVVLNTVQNLTAYTISLGAGQSFTIVGNVVTSAASGPPYTGILFNTPGTFNIFGNVTASNIGFASGIFINNSGAGTINVAGNIIGATSCIALLNSSTGTINITGNVTGGTNGNAVSAQGVMNSSVGSVFITGNVFGASSTTTGSAGQGVINTGSGSIFITGTVTASAQHGFVNSSSGSIIHTGIAQSSLSTSAIGVGSLSQITALTGPFLTTTTGINPVLAIRWFWLNTSPPATYYEIRIYNANPALGVIRPLYTADSVGGNPAVSNVRAGTIYGPSSELTGTCAVPPAASVFNGVPVDNTTGTAAITAAEIRAAIGLASANLDTQLSGKPTAAQIRTELSTELSRIDANISSRLDSTGTLARVTLVDTTTTLTNAPNVPTPTEIADQVRIELTPELDRIDVDISSRLSPDGTLSRVNLTDTVTDLTNAPDVPTPEEISESVREELSTELERLANCSTTQEVADMVEGVKAN